MPKTTIHDPGAHHTSSGLSSGAFCPIWPSTKRAVHRPVLCSPDHHVRYHPAQDHEHHYQLRHGCGHHADSQIVLSWQRSTSCSVSLTERRSISCPASATSWACTSRPICAATPLTTCCCLDHTYYNNTKVGTIMGRITNDLFDVTEFAHHCPEEFFIAAIKILARSSSCARPVSPDAGGVCLRAPDGRGVGLPEPAPAGRFRQQRVQIGELNSTIEDSLLGQGVVKAFAAEEQSGTSSSRATGILSRSKRWAITPWRRSIPPPACLTA